MTTKTVSKKRAPAKKATTKKTTAKKTTARKPRAVKAPPKKTMFERLETSPIAIPFKVANKTFMASLGLMVVAQQELDKRYKAFDKKFTQYAKEGEKVFDRWEDRVEDLRDDVEDKFEETRERVRETLEKAA